MPIRDERLLEWFSGSSDIDPMINAGIESRTTRAQFIMDNWTWITYPLPVDGLPLGQDELTLYVRSSNPGIEGHPRVDNVEICVQYV